MNARRSAHGRIFETALAIGLAAGLSACAGGFDPHSAADATSGTLVPSATVAATGLDGFVSANHPRVEREAGVEREARVETDSPTESADRAAPSITVTSTSAPARVDVTARHADALAIRLTQLTVGEALAYLSGGRLSGEPDLARLTTRAGEPVGIDDTQRFDLDHLVDRGTGLFALDVEATDGDDDAHVHTLLQLSPLHMAVDLVGEKVRVELADADGEAVGAARVELMDADGRLLGEAVTDPTGRCTVVVSSAAQRLAPALMGDQRFVVARHGTFRALAQLD